MTLANVSAGYSADVRLDLYIAGQHFPLAQIGGNQLIFPTPVHLPAGTGEVVMSVDGQQRRWAITLEKLEFQSLTVAATFKDIA